MLGLRLMVKRGWMLTIDLGDTPYGFDQPFEGNEANLYFKRMKEFSGLSVNYILDHSDYKAHFNRTDIRGNIKKVFPIK
jgi:hypothetical protein